MVMYHTHSAAHCTHSDNDTVSHNCHVFTLIAFTHTHRNGVSGDVALFMLTHTHTHTHTLTHTQTHTHRHRHTHTHTQTHTDVSRRKLTMGEGMQCGFQ